MIEPSPLHTDTAIDRIRALRRARFIALRAEEVAEREIARQLRELDACTLSTTPDELEKLRARNARIVRIGRR